MNDKDLIEYENMLREAIAKDLDSADITEEAISSALRDVKSSCTRSANERDRYMEVLQNSGSFYIAFYSFYYFNRIGVRSLFRRINFVFYLANSAGVSVIGKLLSWIGNGIRK